MEIVKENILSKIGQTDYVKDGELHTGGTTPSIMVSAEAAAESVEESAEAIEMFEDTGLTVQNGKLCVKVERG